MTPETIDSDRIGPELSLEGVALPPAVGERIGQLFGTDERPRTVADWMTVTRATLGDSYDRQPTVEDLCTSDDGAHTFVDDGGEDGDDTSQSYVCVLDPLVYPFLTGESGTIRSTTPVRGATVAFDVGDGVAVSHEDAVVSIGVSDHVDAVEELTLDTVYRQVCGYVQTFEDREEYETWADGVEAATTPLDAREGVAVARELASALFDATQSPHSP